mgnify:CR=1 FL=1
MHRLKVIIVNISLLLIGIIILEVGLRIFVEFDPGYYTGIRSKDSCIKYPYGEICLNSDGYPDSEFASKGYKLRIGYFGDSVCYGVAAGRGYRITDLLKKHYPGHEHYNFCYLGESVLSRETLGKITEVAEKYSIDHIVYLMNLNDISPLVSEVDQNPGDVLSDNNSTTSRKNTLADNSRLVAIKKFMAPFDEHLRGKSYLYTYIRNKVKEKLTIAGYEASGYRAIELFPDKNETIFKNASERINALNKYFTEMNKRFTLVILPYEMQISTDAAATYRKLNIQWEEGFETGSAQDMLIKNLSPDVNYFNAYNAFNGVRNTIKIGEYYVYNKGDKIDWNHPNRLGHRIISEYLISQAIFKKIQ